MGLFEAAHGWETKKPLPKICDTYPTMMKLGSYILLEEYPEYIIT